MGKVVIDAPKDSDLENIEQLPDRSSLADLYFKPINNAYARVLPEPKKHITKKEFRKLINKTTLYVGLVATAPFMFAEASLAALGSINNGVKIESALILFPASMAAIILLWILSASRTSITDKLGEIGVSTGFVISYLYFCLALVAWPLYKFTYSTEPDTWFMQQIIYFAALCIVGLGTSHALLSLIDNDTWPNIVKMFYLISPILICFVVCLIGII